MFEIRVLRVFEIRVLRVFEIRVLRVFEIRVLRVSWRGGDMRIEIIALCGAS